MTTIAGTGCVDFSAVDGVSIAAAGRASTCQVYNTIIQQFISSALEWRVGAGDWGVGGGNGEQNGLK